MAFFFDIINRVSSVKVVGTNHSLNAQIQERVGELGITNYVRLPKYEKLLQIESTLKNEFVSKIDFMEVRLKGTIVTINYQVRKDSVQIPEKEGAKYAT